MTFKAQPKCPLLHEDLSEMEVDWVLWTPVALGSTLSSLLSFLLQILFEYSRVPGTVLGSDVIAVTKADQTLPCRAHIIVKGQTIIK